MGQMAYVKPMLGQHQFHHYKLEKVNLVKIDTLKFQKEFIKSLMKGYLNLNF